MLEMGPMKEVCMLFLSFYANSGLAFYALNMLAFLEKSESIHDPP